MLTLWNNPWRELARWDPFAQENANTAWTPAVDIVEREGAIELTAEVPGMKPEDIKLDVDGNQLTLSGERKQEKEDKGKGYRRFERSYGRFTRSFTLPENVDKEKIEAHVTEGVLKVVLPTTGERGSKQIPVRGGAEKAKPIQQ